jgi:hypothetical protein
MEILGHSDISMTMNTYSHAVSELQVDAAASMKALLGASPTGSVPTDPVLPAKALHDCQQNRGGPDQLDPAVLPILGEGGLGDLPHLLHQDRHPQRQPGSQV